MIGIAECGVLLITSTILCTLGLLQAPMLNVKEKKPDT